MYRKYRSLIFNRCLRLLGESAGADDATQETFLRLQRHEPDLPGTAVPGWLYRVATNYCLNELRRRRTQAAPEADLSDVIDPAFDESRAANLDFAKRLVTCAPNDVGTTAWLYHAGELDQNQIAQTMGISRRSVTNYLVRFRGFAHRYARNNELEESKLTQGPA